MSLPKKLIQKPFPSNQYFREQYDKTQIYLHHTAGADNGPGVFDYWASNHSRIATFAVIERDGDIFQGFNSSYWAYHLGLKSYVFREHNCQYLPLDKFSIGIELTNWGGLTKKRGKYYTYTNKEIDESEVVTLDKSFRGYKHYHKYTSDQIKSLKELLIYLGEKYSICLSYNEDIFDITERALKNESGVFTHCSVRKDKIDVYPDPDLIKMLKSL